MTTDELIALVESWGLKIVVLPTGETCLRGPRPEEGLDELLKVLKMEHHKREILRRFGPPPAPPKPKLPRRLVRVVEGREVVLCELSPSEAMAAFYAEQLASPGDVLHLQTLHSDVCGRTWWQTYIRTLGPDQDPVH